MSPSTILIIEDEPISALGYRSVLADEAPDAHIDVSHSWVSLPSSPRGRDYDLVLADVLVSGAPSRDIAACVHALCAQYPMARIAMMSATMVRHDARRALEAGAVSVMHKSRSLSQQEVALRTFARGNTYLPTDLVALVPPLPVLAGSAVDITDVDEKIIQLAALGYPDKLIAVSLELSVESVGKRLSRLLAKLDIPTRVELIVRSSHCFVPDLDRRVT